MQLIKLILGDQQLNCFLQEGEMEGQYFGILSEQIQDPEALDFWSRYECAVNNVTLSKVDELESKMPEYEFSVLVGDLLFLGQNIDLQIYPTTRRISFSLPVS